RFDPDEDRAGAVPDVLGVFPAVTPGGGRDRIAGVAEQLVGLLLSWVTKAAVLGSDPADLR
ncbi:hypothetical protein, partial [Mycobacterium sp. PS03-16]|uniref:hypothetical protein n=1 Tax=Mycobacterium sp. PS03-16 TaxID=2559611 RepID=UPI001ADD8B13